MIIKEIDARVIKNSRNEETIEVSVVTEKGMFKASAPSGKSTGSYEAQAFSSKGIKFSCALLNNLGEKMMHDSVQLSAFHDLEIVEEYALKVDKSPWKILGGNALYALEAALLKGMAASQGKELWQFLLGKDKPRKLPLPLGNCIGGGMHVSQDTKSDFQEFLLLPKTKNFYDAYYINLEAYKVAKKFLLQYDRRYEGKLTDEKALAATLSNEEIFDILLKVKGYILSKFKIDLSLGTDMASSTFYKGKQYAYRNPQRNFSKDEQIQHVLSLIEKYDLRYVEDPFHEDDFEAFSRLTAAVKKSGIKCMITGDDLTATQFSRVERAVKEKAITAMIVKPNQNGSILETKRIVDYCIAHDIIPVISHRSGETFDNTIAHLAIGWEIPVIKTGILGKERFAKLHEILRIERGLGRKK